MKNKTKKTIRLILLTSLLALAGTGCATLSRSDQEFLRELQANGIPADEVKVKQPAVAGGLNILPGFGNFYLAAGTQESDQWLYGFFNLLMWPVSPIWGVPQAVIDTNTVNKKETVYHYRYDPIGKAELERRKGAVVPASKKSEVNL